MENLENNTKKNEKFMQGWGFIIGIIIVVTGLLVGLKALMN
jgi:hypothetical protein